MTETVRYGANAPRVAPWAETRLKKYMRAAGISSVLVTSTRRTPIDQARIMYDLAQRHGIDYAKRLYGSAGDQVLNQYVKDVPLSIGPMTAVVVSVGPVNVSLHCSTTSEVLDVSPRSIPDDLHDMFEAALEQGQGHGEIGELEVPPDDPAFHIEFVPGVPDHEIVVLPRTSTGKTVVSLLFILAVGWALTRS